MLLIKPISLSLNPYFLYKSSSVHFFEKSNNGTNEKTNLDKLTALNDMMPGSKALVAGI